MIQFNFLLHRIFISQQKAYKLQLKQFSLKTHLQIMRFFKNLHERFQDYFNYSSVHGFHYIYDRNLNIIERLF